MDGYGRLVETGSNYQDEAQSIYDRMQDFAATSAALKENMSSIRDSVEAVNIAVEESAKGVVNVTEMSVDLTNSVKDIGEQADENENISVRLEGEVGKFKLE